MAENLGGRPTVMTDDVLKKLKSAFDYGCTDEEACIHADISTQTLYNYQNAHPEFLEEKEMRKKKPVLKARSNVVLKIDSGDLDTSKWYLERKEKKEFGNKMEFGFDDAIKPKSITIHLTNDDDATDEGKSGTAPAPVSETE